MERTKKPDIIVQNPIITDKRIEWKNTGKTFRLPHGKIIKPNEIFLANFNEIPIAFRDIILAIDKTAIPTAAAVEKKMLLQVEEVYTLKSVAAGWWDVLNTSGKPVNEAHLRKDEAAELKKALEG